MFGLSMWELVVILAIVMLVFGVGRLPEVGNGLGKGIREFRKAVTGGDSDSSKKDEKAASDDTPSS